MPGIAFQFVCVCVCVGGGFVCVASSLGPGEVENGCLTREHTGPHAHGHQLCASSAVPAEGTDRVADTNEAMQTDDGQEKNGACRYNVIHVTLSLYKV